VLAGSSAYAIAELFDWREGLEEEPGQAPQFYVAIAVATLIGLALALTGIGAIRALFIAAVVNGVVAPLLIAAITAVAGDEELLGHHRNGSLATALGWATAAIMAAASLGMLLAFLLGR
jgi:Mn2+/Fe2+ NRAMP family transporter